MNLRTLIFVNNACYKAARTIVPKGIMVHSTGANNPNLKRYVGPDDGLLGKNQYNNHWNQDKPDSRQVCVHGFIGKLADGSIATYQTLPWNHRGWHAGGDANNTHISFEICEDQEEYNRRYEALMERYEAARSGIAETDSKLAERNAKREKITRFLGDLKRHDGLLEEFDEKLWLATVDFVTVHSESEMTVRFKDGMEATVDVETK